MSIAFSTLRGRLLASRVHESDGLLNGITESGAETECAIIRKPMQASFAEGGKLGKVHCTTCIENESDQLF
jgi:hypothetical protein